MTFAGSNAGLAKWGGIAAAVCLILCGIGIVTLKSLNQTSHPMVQGDKPGGVFTDRAIAAA